jgi:formylglycine-generating enzyme required for sulfatase activity
MHGNVWEWCRDCWHASYEGAPIDGSAWRRDADQGTRVLRGGSWSAQAGYCRAAARRFSGHPRVQSREIGFRVVMAGKG